MDLLNLFGGGNNQSNPTGTPSPTPPNTGADDITQLRQNALEAGFQQKYQLDKGGKIDWYKFADISDDIAKATKNEEDFRKDVWHLFGNDRKNLLQHFDTTNPGLPDKFKNVNPQGQPIYSSSQPTNQGEQLHHYLGGVTGDTGKGQPFNIPSHHLNGLSFGGINPASWTNEMREQAKTGQWNQGDENLFNKARIHYYDFNRPGGRMSVGDNIRKMLLPRTQPNEPRF